MPCRVAYRTHKHSTADFNITDFTPYCQLGRLLSSSMRARKVPAVSTNSTDVGAFSTRCELAQHPLWVPMPRLRKAHAATQRYACGRPKYPMRVPVVLHESTRSTLSESFTVSMWVLRVPSVSIMTTPFLSSLSTPCEHTEYPM